MKTFYCKSTDVPPVAKKNLSATFFESQFASVLAWWKEFSCGNGLGMGTNLCGDRCVWVWFCVPCSLHVRNKPYCEVNPGLVVCRVECRTIQTCHDPARRLGQVNGRVGDKNSVTFCIEPSTRFGLWIFVGSVLMLRSLQCIGTVGWVTGRASSL